MGIYPNKTIVICLPQAYMSSFGPTLQELRDCGQSLTLLAPVSSSMVHKDGVTALTSSVGGLLTLVHLVSKGRWLLQCAGRLSDKHT